MVAMYVIDVMLKWIFNNWKNEMTNEEKIKIAIEEVAFVISSQITVASKLEDIGMDSLDMVKLEMELEDVFCEGIDLKGLNPSCTVQQVIDCVISQLD